MGHWTDEERERIRQAQQKVRRERIRQAQKARRDLDQADWERSADNDPNRVADCGCPEQIIADEGHQEGCEVR